MSNDLSLHPHKSTSLDLNKSLLTEFVRSVSF